MEWLALISTLPVVVAIYAAIMLALAYPLFRLRGILDGGKGSFSEQLAKLDGRFNGRLVSFHLIWGSPSRWGIASSRSGFFITFYLQSSNGLSLERQTALAAAEVSFNKAANLVESLTRVNERAFGYSNTSAPWVEAWVNQPEVHDALNSIFRNSGAQGMKLRDRAFRSYSYAPLLAARRQNVQALLKGLIALDESLVKAVPGE